MHGVPDGPGLLRGAKVAPATAACESLWHEMYHRAKEEAKRRSENLDRGALRSLATATLTNRSQKWKKAQKQKAIGRSVLDIELATWSDDGQRLRFLGYPGVRLAAPVTTKPAVFGGVPVWQPTQTKALLRSMYPDGFATRIFKDPATGRCKPVPATVPRHLGPS